MTTCGEQKMGKIAKMMKLTTGSQGETILAYMAMGYSNTSIRETIDDVDGDTLSKLRKAWDVEEEVAPGSTAEASTAEAKQTAERKKNGRGRPRNVPIDREYSDEHGTMFDATVKASGIKPYVEPPSNSMVDWLLAHEYIDGENSPYLYRSGVREYVAMYIHPVRKQEWSDEKFKQEYDKKVGSSCGTLLNDLRLVRRMCPAKDYHEIHACKEHLRILQGLYSIYNEEPDFRAGELMDMNYDDLLRILPDGWSALVFLMMVTGNRCANVCTLAGHQVLINLAEGYIIIQWRYRKAQKKRSLRADVKYLLSWTDVTPPPAVVRWLEEERHQAFECKKNKRLPPRLFEKLPADDNYSRTAKLTRLVRGLTAQAGRKSTKPYEDFTVKVFRCRMASVLHGEDASADDIKRLLDHKKATSEAFYRGGSIAREQRLFLRDHVIAEVDDSDPEMVEALDEDADEDGGEDVDERPKKNKKK